jgi:hypothetical protein
MNKVYKRTENGIVTHISVREALAEVNHAMMDGKRDVRSMSSGRTQHNIEYKDGRTVRLVLVDAPAEQPAETDRKGRRIVTVKGKRYIVSKITPARPWTEGARAWTPEAYLSYWAERNGETFGATRNASASSKPGTIGRAIWDAVNQ